MRVLVGCEFSGRVRQSFRKRGHDAWSCDILPARDGSPFHIQEDLLSVLDLGWDMLIAFPPCTHLAISGARWFKDKQKEQAEAVEFFLDIAKAPIDKIAIENPVGIMSTRFRKPDQIVQPYMFGHPERKRTCLWLKNLPLLEPTDNVEPEEMVEYANGTKMGKWYADSFNVPAKQRAQYRSITFIGIAEAMAEQWGLHEQNK